MNLTNATVQGVAGGIGSPASIAGQIGLISGPPLVSPFGVAGFAGLTGEYRTFPGGTGTLSSAQLTLQARVGGLLLGFVDGGQAEGLASPAAFSDFDARSYPDIPVVNLLLGIFNFDLAAGNGFVLPDSGEVAAWAIPEPSALLSLILGSMLLVAAHVSWRTTRTVSR